MSVLSLYELGLVELWIPGIGEPLRREGGLCMLAEGGIKGDMEKHGAVDRQYIWICRLVL